MFATGLQAQRIFTELLLFRFLVYHWNIARHPFGPQYPLRSTTHTNRSVCDPTADSAAARTMRVRTYRERNVRLSVETTSHNHQATVLEGAHVFARADLRRPMVPHRVEGPLR